MLFLGFAIKMNPKINFKKEINKKPIYNVLLVIIIISYFLRWYELFVLRDLSFLNYPKDNRILNDFNLAKTNYLFNIASVLKSLYFFPLIIVISSELRKSKIRLFFAYLLMFFPIIESILKGTRKPFFEIFLILIISYLLFNTFKITFKKILIGFTGLVVLLIISANILYLRESKNVTSSDVYYDKILNARYNDLLPLQDNIKSFFFNKKVPEPIKAFVFINMQTGQYILHGLFEFNHINDTPLPITYGSYTFNVPVKILSKMRILSNIEITNPSPREYVYLTAFGGLFIDFRWLSLLFFLLFGSVQKYFFLLSEKSFIFKPILIYILIINVHLPIINYLKGSGIYPFLAFAFLLATLIIRDKILNEKSFST